MDEENIDIKDYMRMNSFNPTGHARDERDVVLKCTCREKIIVREGEDILLKSRIVKISESTAKAKCKRCDQWVIVPIRMA